MLASPIILANNNNIVAGIDHDPTPEDWDCLVQKAKDLESRIHCVQGKQNDYNAVLERCYVVEEAQRLQMQDLRDRVREEEVEALTNPDFARWIKRQSETMATEKDIIGSWFNEESLLALTPFAAVVPFPRYITEKGLTMCESTLNQFQLSQLYVQTIGVKSPIATIAPALLPRASHLLEDDRASKSDLGPLGYIAAGQASGAAVNHLIESTPLLKDSLHETSCLLINDRRISASMVFKCLVVRGRCAVAEVGCSSECLPIFQSGGQEIDGQLLPIDVVAYGLGAFVKSALTPILKARTYEALILANITGLDGGSPMPTPELFFSQMQMKDITFQLLNMDYPDNSNFDMYSPEDVRSVAGYVSRRDVQARGLVELPPALRMVVKGGTNPLSATVALAIRQLERSADRYKAFCGSSGVQPICSVTMEQQSEYSPSAEAAADGGCGAAASAADPVGRLSAAHMDPFMNLSQRAPPPGHIVPTNQKFFSEVDAIGRVLDAAEQRMLRPSA